MSTTHLQTSLLRPAVLHILRAAGFHAARPAAAETVVHLTARYLILLAQRSASYAWSNGHDTVPTIIDVRMALQEVGAFSPEIGPLEEQLNYDDDMRGVEAFVGWMDGDTHKEIRRIAGLHHTAGEIVDIEPGVEREDFLTALKKKHSKTGEESRFQGTALGKPAEEKQLKIEGSDMDNIRSWQKSLQSQKDTTLFSEALSPTAMSIASSPLSEI